MAYKINYENTFILDEMDTWPDELSHLLQENKEILRSYFTRKIEIERLQDEDPIYRYNIPGNPYNDKYEEMINKIDVILGGHNILGFHCSNLIDYEQKLILKNGLSPLSKRLIDEKLETAFTQGFLSQDLYFSLKETNLSETPGRTSFIFCFHAISTLKKNPGLSKLLTIWGGESIYWTKNEETIKKLSCIGEPSIVVLTMLYKDACHLHDLSVKIIDKFLSELDPPHYFSDVDNHFNYKLDVVEILTQRDEKFEFLTNFSKWGKQGSLG